MSGARAPMAGPNAVRAPGAAPPYAPALPALMALARALADRAADEALTAAGPGTLSRKPGPPGDGEPTR